MNNISVDFAKKCGKIKPMHATNNGPVYKFAADQRVTNLYSFRDAGIPYARNHDAAFYSTYGGEHTVDVAFIFPNFDADPYDPDSYDFVLTDEYLKVIELSGAKTFYRLGSKIEHWKKKYNTLPPKDFKKWAVICEHIIRHYNYGWADGFNMGIEYWEIWNEPDLDADDSPNKRCWGGTTKEFYELYNITAKHLKSCFPELKIGGPSMAHPQDDWMRGFFESLEVKPDFISWHIYAANVDKVRARIRKMREWIDRYGYTDCESILNEWNYVRGWEGDDWIYSLKTDKNMKGAAFIASTMLMSQCEALDMLMYYDARPGGMNGMYSTDLVSETLKGYHPFYMFNKLYMAGEQVEGVSDSEFIQCVGATGDEKYLMLSYFDDEDKEKTKDIKIEFKNVNHGGKVRLEYYLLDETHDNALIREEIFTANEFSAYVTVKNYSVMLLKISEA